MSVVINDFEIIPDSGGEETGADEDSGHEAVRERASIRPFDVTKIVDRRERRERRLRAH